MHTEDTASLNEKRANLTQVMILNTEYNNSLGSDLVYDMYSQGETGHECLLSLIIDRYQTSNTQIHVLDGLIFELISNSQYSRIRKVVDSRLPYGVVPLCSDVDIDYLPLQRLLVDKSFQQADSLTQSILCRLSQLVGDHERDWLYFTDIPGLPSIDLLTIDNLWKVHSNGLFGLSVQRRIWLATNSNWDNFWAKIGWKVNNVSCRYPNDFVWNVSAPPGHLPLFNQLRGVQVLSALFNHHAWL
uniref:GUN4-like domain-containing protein n=1 Tax=Yamadaella caenomyce TaxID=259029 RepID=A0A1G4NYI6_9FLOR|nr:Hypothetical protein ycf53 [Yamadaella caenomyce]SCW23717.1 Hypothetical protein ycf53 [Yamadaella caenomyce]